MRRRQQAVRLIYHVNTGLGYHYRNVSLDIRDDSLTYMLAEWHLRTLIRSGDPYDIDVLEAERTRVVRRMQNLGYFRFNRNNIEFLIDSSLNAHLMDITMVINPPAPGQHSRRYEFADVRIFPEGTAEPLDGRAFDTTVYRARFRGDTATQDFYFFHSEPLQIKPRVVASKLLTRPGESFNLSNVDRTYENLLDLRVYSASSVTLQPQPIDTNDPMRGLLNATIEVRQGPRNTWSADFEATNATTGLQGASAHTSLQNRNLFGGAEILSLRLRGLLELQYLLNREERHEGVDLVNSFNIGLDATLDVPRFIAPFEFRRAPQYRPRTLINLGYSYQSRFKFYERHLVNVSLAYLWRQPRVSHTFFPLDISMVNITLDSIFEASINNLSQGNWRLKHQYSDHFIFATRYNFAFSGQTARPVSFNAFRFSAESSGNLLYLISNAINAPKHEDRYHFLHLAYAQYVRFDADFRRYWQLSENHVLVTRLMSGGGFAYGNSLMVLPYEKGFFAGGNNNIRAWPMNRLGPGSYQDPEGSRIERIGDIVVVSNVEYRFPIGGAFKGALFVDAGNIWVRDTVSFPNGEFAWGKIPNDLAIGGGFGLRLDLGFFVIRLDAATPLRNPARPDGERWVVRNTQMRDFVLNFGIGYPF
jgi:outer membrane protein assembly factor BamA